MARAAAPAAAVTRVGSGTTTRIPRSRSGWTPSCRRLPVAGHAATITDEKGGGQIRLRSSRLEGEVEGLAGIPAKLLPEIARAPEEGCTISAAIRGAVEISVDIRESDGMAGQ